MQRIAIITGMAEEADIFLKDQGEVTVSRAMTVRHINFASKAIAIASSGIGKVNAASAATWLAAEHRADLLMIIGTAGKIGTLDGDCFILDEAVQADYGALRSDGFAHYSAGSMPFGPASIEAYRAMELPDIGLPRARVATADCFVECPDHGAALVNNLGAMLVDMETAALAQVAARLGLPWAAIKATSDDANGDSVSDFAENLHRAARRAAQAAERAIAAL